MFLFYTAVCLFRSDLVISLFPVEIVSLSLVRLRAFLERPFSKLSN